MRFPWTGLVLSVLAVAPTIGHAQSAPWCAAERKCGWFWSSDLTAGLALARSHAYPTGGVGFLLLTGSAGLMRTVGRQDAVGLVAFAAGERLEDGSTGQAFATRLTLGLAARYRHSFGGRAYVEAQAGVPFSGRGGVSRNRLSPMLGLTWHPVAPVGIGTKFVTENYVVRECPSYPACLSAPPVTSRRSEYRWYVEARVTGQYGAVGAAVVLMGFLAGLFGPAASISW